MGPGVRRREERERQEGAHSGGEAEQRGRGERRGGGGTGHGAGQDGHGRRRPAGQRGDLTPAHAARSAPLDASGLRSRSRPEASGASRGSRRADRLSEVVEPVHPGCSSAAEVDTAAATDFPDEGELEPEPPAQSPDRGVSRRRRGEEQLVVLPAAGRDTRPRTPIGMRGERARRDGKQTAVEVERDPARERDVPRVLHEPVAQVDARRRHADQRRPQREPRDRPALPLDRHASRGEAHRGAAAPPDLRAARAAPRPSRASPSVPDTQTRSPGPRPRPPERATRRDLPSHGHGEREPRRSSHVSSDERRPAVTRQRAETSAEPARLRDPESARDPQRHERPARPSAHRSEVGEVDRQRLVPHVLEPAARTAEVHALDDCVHRHAGLSASTGKHRRVVARTARRAGATPPPRRRRPR